MIRLVDEETEDVEEIRRRVQIVRGVARWPLDLFRRDRSSLGLGSDTGWSVLRCRSSACPVRAPIAAGGRHSLSAWLYALGRSWLEKGNP